VLVCRLSRYWILQVCQLRADNTSGHGSFKSGLLNCLRFDGAPESVIKSWNTNECSRPQQLEVVDQLENVSMEVTDRDSSPEGGLLRYSLINYFQVRI
jgi:hypothetical protein